VYEVEDFVYYGTEEILEWVDDMTGGYLFYIAEELDYLLDPRMWVENAIEGAIWSRLDYAAGWIEGNAGENTACAWAVEDEGIFKQIGGLAKELNLYKEPNYAKVDQYFGQLYNHIQTVEHACHFEAIYNDTMDNLTYDPLGSIAMVLRNAFWNPLDVAELVFYNAVAQFEGDYFGMGATDGMLFGLLTNEHLYSDEVYYIDEEPFEIIDEPVFEEPDFDEEPYEIVPEYANDEATKL